MENKAGENLIFIHTLDHQSCHLCTDTEGTWKSSLQHILLYLKEELVPDTKQ